MAIWFSGFRGEDLNVIFINFTENPGIDVKLLLAM
jgi:hypothetical protein